MDEVVLGEEAGRDRADEEAQRADHQEGHITVAGLVRAALGGSKREHRRVLFLLMIGSFHVVESRRVVVVIGRASWLH